MKFVGSPPIYRNSLNTPTTRANWLEMAIILVFWPPDRRLVIYSASLSIDIAQRERSSYTIVAYPICWPIGLSVGQSAKCIVEKRLIRSGCHFGW